MLDRIFLRVELSKKKKKISARRARVKTPDAGVSFSVPREKIKKKKKSAIRSDRVANRSMPFVQAPGVPRDLIKI